MSIKEVPAKFQASDGKNFDTQEEAERHESLVSARAAFSEARTRLGIALACTQVTADGSPFDLGWHDYWYVTPGYGGSPRLQKVTFYLYNFDFDEVRDEFQIVQHETDGRRILHRISTLYANRRAAEAALLVAQEGWLAQCASEVEETRSRIAEGRPVR